MKRHLKFTLPGFCLIILLVCGCDSSSSSHSEKSQLDGYVAAKSDVAAAGIQVTDTDGNVIAEKNAPATSDSGAFRISVKNLPYEFRVISSGGTEYRQNYDGGTESGENLVAGGGVPLGNVDYKIMGQFEAFDPETDTVYINLVTTLVCVYLDRNPDKSLSEATSAVKTFLDIPDETDIGAGLYHNSKYFSPDLFEMEALGGNVELFMEMLVDEMVEGSVEKHPFIAPIGGGGTELAGVGMGTAARNGAIAWAAGFALNKGMEAVFPGTGAPTQADITAMKSMLTQIQVQLTELGSQTAASTAEIKSEIDKVQYNIGTMHLADYVSLVKTTFIDLKNEMDLAPADQNPSAIRDCLDTIRTDIVKHAGTQSADGTAKSPGKLHLLLFGPETANPEGLYKFYADKLKTEKRFLTKENYQDKVKNLVRYYNQIETMAAYLVSEYCNAEGQTTKAHYHSEQLLTNSQAQQAWLDSVVPYDDEILVDRDQNLMIYSPYCDPSNNAPYGKTRCLVTKKYIEGKGFASGELFYVISRNFSSGGFYGRNPTKAEIDSFFRLCGQYGYGNLTECLASQGWILYDFGWYFTTDETIIENRGTLAELRRYEVFGLDAHAWYTFDYHPWRLDREDPDHGNTGWNWIPVRQRWSSEKKWMW